MKNNSDESPIIVDDFKNSGLQYVMALARAQEEKEKTIKES